MAKYDKKLVEQLLSGEGDPAALAWLAGEGELKGVDGRLALSAIEAAARKQDVALLQSLEKASKPLKKAGRAALHKLKAQGVEVDRPRPSSFSLGREAITVEPRAFVGPPDQQGYSAFLLSVTDDEGTCVVMGYFGGGEGFKALSHGHVSRGDLRRMCKEVVDNDPSLVEMPFHEALGHVLAGADQAVALTGGLPHDWEHFVTHVDEGTRNAARLLDPSKRIQPELDKELLADSEALIHDAWFALWPVTEKAMDRVVEEIETLASSELEVSEQSRGQAMDQALADAAIDAIEGEAREEWLRRARLATSAGLAQGDQEKSRRAANLVRALEAGLGGDDIPMVERTLQMQLAFAANEFQRRMAAQQLAGMQHDHSHDHG